MANGDHHFAAIDEGFLVSAQLTIDDISAAKGAGVTTIVNNRPDGEEPGQPRGDVIAAAAAAEGIAYVAVPVGRTGVSARHLDELDAATAAPGATLAYCRSGMRSALVWAMARARSGADIDTLVEKAAAAGYDLSAQRGLLEAAQDG